MELGHLVAGQVERLETVPGEVRGDLRALPAPGGLDPHEDVRLPCVGDAVVELRHAAAADELAEFFQAPRPLRDRDGEHGLAVLADLGALGDEPQPVEIEIRATGHGDQRFTLEALPLDVGLRAGDGQRAGRLQHCACVLEDVLRRRADVVGVHQNDLVEVFFAEPEGLLADFAHRDAVGEEPGVRQLHAAARRQRIMHGRRIARLDADHLHLRPHPLDAGRHARRQPAAAHGHEDRMQRPLVLPQDFQGDGPLARDHVGIVKGMDEGQAVALRQLARVGVGLVIGIAMQHDLAAARLHGMDFHLRGRHGHDDDRAGAEPFGGEGHALRMVARRGAHDAARQLGRGELRHLVEGAAQLEGEHALHVLALQEQGVVEPGRERGRLFQRCLARHVIDAGGEDFLQIVGHGGGRRHTPSEGVVLPADRRVVDAEFPYDKTCRRRSRP